jgi:hypothetical protein
MSISWVNTVYIYDGNKMGIMLICYPVVGIFAILGIIHTYIHIYIYNGDLMGMY